MRGRDIEGGREKGKGGGGGGGPGKSQMMRYLVGFGRAIEII